MRVRGLLVASMLVTAGVVLAGANVAVAATVSGTVAMYSDTGDYIGAGAQQLFAGPLAVQGNAGDVTINFSTGNGASWTLEFAAPPGQTLQPGIYDRAGRAAFRGTGEPGIDIFGDGRGCNTDFGRFEVKDIAVDASGVVDRLWLVYEQHCEGAEPALFGEVRLGEPATAGAVTAFPTLVRWPANSHGTPETTVPVRFVASSPVTLTSTSLTGSNPSDFTIRSDGCSGQTLAPGGTCDVWVRSTPSVPGLRTAALVVRDSAGNAYTVPLQGWTYGGTTRLVMNSDPGDYVGGGQQYSFDPTNAVLQATGTPEEVSFSVASSDWSGDFAASQGDIFTTGSNWTGAQRYPFQGTSPGLDVFGAGRGCNTLTGQFSIVEATYNSDGSLRTFGVKFEQHCEGAQPALYGEFDWRVGDNTPLAPWMVPDGSTASGSGGSGSNSGGGSGGTNAGGGSGSNTGGGSGSNTGGGSSSTTGGSTSTSNNSPATTTGAASTSGATKALIPASFATQSTAAVARTLGRTLTVLRADSGKSANALGQLRRHPANRRGRASAAAALNHLRQDVVAEQRLMRTYRPRTARLQVAWRGMLAAISAWDRALVLEQRSLAGAPTAVMSRTAQLDARARAAQAVALRDLAAAVRQL